MSPCTPWCICAHVLRDTYAPMYSVIHMRPSTSWWISAHVLRDTYTPMYSVIHMRSCTPWCICAHVLRDTYAPMYSMIHMRPCTPWYICAPVLRLSTTGTRMHTTLHDKDILYLRILHEWNKFVSQLFYFSDRDTYESLYSDSFLLFTVSIYSGSSRLAACSE